MAASLLVLGVFMTATYNVRRALADLEGRKEVVVYLKDSAPSGEVADLRARMDSLYGVSTYVSKQEAWDEFARELGGDELLKAVGENPLPASIRLRLKPQYLHFAAMERIADALAGESVVEEDLWNLRGLT